jgi:NADP-dependent 3-hydroxy acid dehydrogenase YdfG
MMKRTIVVVGAGPGVSASVARRFARDGNDVALLGNDAEPLAVLTDELMSSGATVRSAVVDVTDTVPASTALRDLAGGAVDVLQFNPSAFRQKDPLELQVSELLADVALGVGALLTAVQAIRPYLRLGSRVVVTGSVAADKPWSQAASLGVQKAGIRNLVHGLDATLAPHGIRAVSVTLGGVLSQEGPFTPDRVAEAIHAAVGQDEDGWRTEILYEG